jgi:hypothetical protein
MYFVAGLSEKVDRAKDEDIKTKKYYCVDIDIRLIQYKKNKVVISQEELDVEIENIIKLLDSSEFNDYCGLVNS